MESVSQRTATCCVLSNGVSTRSPGRAMSASFAASAAVRGIIGASFVGVDAREEDMDRLMVGNYVDVSARRISS